MRILRKPPSFLLVGLALTAICEAHKLDFGPCKDPDNRCLPIPFCPEYHKRLVAKEHETSMTFHSELVNRSCTPETKAHNTRMDFCCPKPKIRCRIDNNRIGVCTRLAQCPPFRNRTETELIAANETSLCYVHNHKSFYCCPDPMCVSFPSFCDGDDDPGHKSAWVRIGSAFPECETGGSLVPRALCHQGVRFEHTTPTTCCTPPRSPSLISHPAASALASVSCGQAGEVDKIYLGNQTQPGEFPWMVALRYHNNRATHCAGTLVHPSYVLTAKHCLKHQESADVTVRLGDHLLHRESAYPGAQEVAVAQIIRHPNYDITMLKLQSAAELVPGSVQPICLPIYDSLRMHLPNRLTITGWGRTGAANLVSNVLLKADMTVDPRCVIHSGFCAVGTGHARHCQGDSGGPYQAPDTYNGSVRFVQYGVISAGAKMCAESNTANVAVYVGYFVNWILDKMEL